MEPIAIVGIGCRFPQAAGKEAYWKLLAEGSSGIAEVPPERWNADKFYDQSGQTRGRMNTRRGGFVSDPDLFDPKFFGITPREAEKMDPQHRMLLQTAWEALEDASILPSDLDGREVGVYIGLMGKEWSDEQVVDLEDIDAHTGSGNGCFFAANRLSYHLNIRGPSIAVDTACSSSLVSVYLACQGLSCGEAELAIAGGVNLILSPALNIFYTRAGLSSSDGRCKSFSAHADGIGRGEGAGVVILKTLAAAQRDGDRIYACIHGGAVNQDGRSNGITAPNRWSQEAVLKSAYRRASIDLSAVEYVEAHGTGTIMGDPIECNALKAVLGRARSTEQPCYIGSVKSNIGHLEGAAGIAGVIKVALALQHGVMPKTLHCDTLNPLLKITGSGIEINREQRCFRQRHPVAGVSSFGLGGTNAHLVMKACAQQSPPRFENDSGRQLLVLSAKTRAGLIAQAKQYLDYLFPVGRAGDDGARYRLDEICYHQLHHRTRFNACMAVAGSDIPDMCRQLSGFIAKGRAAHVVIADKAQLTSKGVAFLFSGQGSQYLNMASGLYASDAGFARDLNRCDALFAAAEKASLIDVIYGGAEAPEAEGGVRLDQTRFTQPALFALEYALANHWQRRGVRPCAVMGHSIGEFSAAVVAGVMTLEEGMALVSARGRLMQALPRDGAMLSVEMAADNVRDSICTMASKVAIAAVNGPCSTVISGCSTALKELRQCYERQGVVCRQLVTSHAFHSPLMAPMIDAFYGVAKAIVYRDPVIPYISNVTGRPLAAGDIQAEYWLEHTLGCVRYSDGLKSLAESGCQAFLEIGPQATLTALGKRCLPDSNYLFVNSLSPGVVDDAALLDAHGSLYIHGHLDALPALYPAGKHRRIDLPTYPFARHSLWQRKVVASVQEELVFGRSAASADDPGNSVAGDCQADALSVAVSALVAGICGLKTGEIALHDRLQEDLGVDSMLLVELKNKLELAYLDGNKIPMDDLMAIATVADAIDFIRTHQLAEPLPA